MPDASKEHEYRAEAQRLALLPTEEQRQVLAVYRTDAENRKASAADRNLARERLEAVTRHLRTLNRRKKKL